MAIATVLALGEHVTRTQGQLVGLLDLPVCVASAPDGTLSRTAPSTMASMPAALPGLSLLIILLDNTARPVTDAAGRSWTVLQRQRSADVLGGLS
jgi:hypothetical protein